MERVKSFRGMLPVLIAGATTCILIIAEPNMSVTICMGALMLVILFIAGIKIKHLAIMMLPILIALPLLIIAEPYRLKRLMAFLDPWASPKGEGYQLIQSLYGLGAGGLFGVGLFNSTQKLLFLPFAESDFILSIVGEETGFIGIVLLFVICTVIILRCVNIATKSKSFFCYLLCMGIAALFTLQIVVNALVVTGSIPPTGIPFPLVSSGNTQILTFMSAFGIVNSVHKSSQLTKKRAFA
jgi:cell division protein FtsW